MQSLVSTETENDLNIDNVCYISGDIHLRRKELIMSTFRKVTFVVLFMSFGVLAAQTVTQAPRYDDTVYNLLWG